MNSFWLIVLVSVVSMAGLGYYAWYYLPARIHHWHRQSLRSFARAIDLRAQGRLGPPETMAKAAVEIGKKFRLSARRLRRLELAVYLRDIGMVGVPYAVLNREGGRAMIEQITYNRHVEVGTAIVEQIPGLREIAPLVRDHHSSYVSQPNRPIEHHVLMALSDAYEMAGTLPMEQVIDHLKAHAGDLYHPQVAEAVIAHLQSQPSLMKAIMEQAAAL